MGEITMVFRALSEIIQIISSELTAANAAAALLISQSLSTLLDLQTRVVK